ncbi:hypothetical protein, partial [uncultured Draconibacterium sp.]|uniref:hypothetical protein n=1 Tax=uncultured Draconibacterium sp. TaxID=1573823 RepID=UPI00262EC242
QKCVPDGSFARAVYQNCLPPRAGNKLMRVLIPGEAYQMNLFLPEKLKLYLKYFSKIYRYLSASFRL